MHKFTNNDVTIERVEFAQAILSGTIVGSKMEAQRFMSFVNTIPDAPTLDSLLSPIKALIFKIKN